MNKFLCCTTLKLLFIFCILLFIVGCEKDNGVLPSYSDNPKLQNLVIEQGVFTPKITWVGGYISVFAVNRGEEAKLDSSLVMLVHKSSDEIAYPITFGLVPDGGEELTAQYGGTSLTSLNEDNTYTFWALKNDAWSAISNHPGKCLVSDDSLQSGNIRVKEDTVFISSFSFVRFVKDLDVYLNIENVKARGRLADLYLVENDTSNSPILTWDIKQSGAEGDDIAAMGITFSSFYSPQEMVWEVWSEEEIDGEFKFGTQNVIQQPVVLGQSFEGTRVFKAFPEEGLERGRQYYLWIANKQWDGLTHGRVANYYAYLTFQTY
ncbi:hypothetical protein GF407_08750 [candidate division KSB1 bacterium]|nr:hypothetical protein [candidate division KSB1 bacterium]